MDIEFEAKFLNIDKDKIREVFKKSGATLVRPEYQQKKFNFRLPKEKRSDNAWVRVRDEGDKITLSLKMILGSGITGQKEISLTIDNFDDAVSLLEEIGCERKAYQESKRELWILDDVEITIDEWPALEPFIEIEGKSENAVKDVIKKLGFKYNMAVFGAVGKLYKMKYGISLDEIEDKVGDTVFDNEKLKELKIST